LFARRIHQETGVPIGIIRDAVGGSGIECWTSPQGLSSVPYFEPHLAKLDQLRGNGQRESGSFLMHWLADYDLGENATVPWSSPDLDDSRRIRDRVHDGLSDLGLVERAGIAWSRREITLPDPPPGGSAPVVLGRVAKMDTTFVN